MDLGEDVALGDPVAALRPADNADGVVDRCVLDRPAGAEVDRGHPDGEGTEPSDRSVARSRRSRRTGARGSASASALLLRPDPAVVRLERRAVVESRRNAVTRVAQVAAVAERHEMRRGGDRELREVRGPSPRNVAIASRISSAFPTACPSG